MWSYWSCHDQTSLTVNVKVGIDAASTLSYAVGGVAVLFDQ